MIARHLLAATLLAASICSSLPPAVADNFSSQSADGLSDQIVGKEIELMQMSTRFRLNNPRETALHKWTVAALSTTAYAVADAGNIVTFTNGFRYHTHPQDFSKGRAESGPFLILLGELCFLTRTLAQTSLDVAAAWRTHDRGFDKRTFEHRAEQLHNEIRALLQQRSAVATTADAQQEQAVLESIAAAADRQFAVNYARAVRLQAFRFWDNTMANSTSATGAFAGALPTYLAAVRKRPHLTGPGGIGFIVSGSLFMADVAVARLISLRAERRSRARLDASLAANATGGGATPDVPGSGVGTTARVAHSAAELQTQVQQLPLMAMATPDGSVRRKSYDLIVESLKEHDLLDARERQRERRKIWHDQIWNTIEGGANLAAGAVIANAGFKYAPGPDPFSQYYGARHFLTRFSWGAVTFTPSASGGIIDTPGEAVVTELINRGDCNRGLCPERVLTKTLSNLEEAKGLVKAP